MQNPLPNADEIDLLHLLAKVTRFLVRNWLIIVLSIAGCVILSWVAYRNAPGVFASEMVVQSKVLSQSYASQVVKNLQKQISEKDDSSIAAQLSITAAEASLLVKISVETPFSDRVNMLEEDKLVFLLPVQVSDPHVLPKLQRGLISFFENLEFVKLRVAEKRKGYQKLIVMIDQEIGALDSLPKANTGVLYPPRILKKPGKDVRILNPALFDASAVNVFMLKDKIEAQEKLAILLNGIEVIQGFTPFRRPIEPKFSNYMGAGFSSGILLALVLLGLRLMQQLFKKYPA